LKDAVDRRSSYAKFLGNLMLKAGFIFDMKVATGKDLNYTPYSDGMFDLTLGGKKIRDRISGADLLAITKSLR